MFWAVCGLAAFGIIASGVAWVVRAKAVTELAATQVTPPPKPPPIPTVDLLVQSVAPQAKLLFRGASLLLPYRGEVAASKTPEMLEISAPGFQGRRFWIKLDRARSFTVALPQGSGAEDATYNETLIASGAARHVEPEAPPPPPAPEPAPVEKRPRAPEPKAPEQKAPESNEPEPVPPPVAPAPESAP